MLHFISMATQIICNRTPGVIGHIDINKYKVLSTPEYAGLSIILIENPSKKIRLGTVAELNGGIGYLKMGSKNEKVYIVEQVVGSLDEVTLGSQEMNEQIDELDDLLEAMKLSCVVSDDDYSAF